MLISELEANECMALTNEALFCSLPLLLMSKAQDVEMSE